MSEYRLSSRDFSRSVFLVTSIMILLGSVASSDASVYSSLLFQSQITVSSPEVILQNGTAGTSTIYTNSTSAKVNTGAGSDVEDYVDNNTFDVDNSTDKGTHSNFTAQQYGPDSTYDTLTEGGFLGTNEYIWISGNDDFVRKLNKSDPGGTEMLSWNTGTTYPFGIEYQYEDGNEYIYLVEKGSGVDALIKFDANTGEELTRWSILGYSGDAEGLAWNGSRWFIADRADDLIYQVEPANPTVAERSFSYSGISYCTGLGWDGSYLWATDEGSDTVYQIDIYGNIQASWSFTDPTGIAYDSVSGHLWIVSGSTGYLYEYYANGTEINSWDPSGTAPEGVAYAILDDYQLDLEVQWTNVDYDETNEELAINLQKGNNTHSLDATGGYMIVGNGTPDWGSSTGTISFWIKWDTFGSGPTRPRPWGQHENMEMSVSTYATEEGVQNRLWVDWGSTITIQSNTNFETTAWYFIAIVWNENTDNLFLYVGDENNAPMEDTHISTWTNTVSAVGVTENNFMNSFGSSYPTDGHGDDLRYWSIDRSSAEIQSDYNTELTGSETNLMSYFKLNSNFDDIGPNNSDGSGSGSYSFSSDVPFEAFPSENIRVDVWNGSVWQNLLTNLTNGWNNKTVSSYLTSSNFSIRFNGANETGDTTQDSWSIDAALLHLWTGGTYDYVLRVNNTVTDSWEIRLKKYSNSSIGRLQNCTIYFHNSTDGTSSQIVIETGAFVNETGAWYDLGSLETIYIAMTVEANSTGTSHVCTYLEILIPSTTTYAQYIITFEIT